jgi:type III pantothenate kinase
MIFNLSKTFFKKNEFLYLQSIFCNMILTIDVGNSRVKAAVFEKDRIVEHFVFSGIYLEKNILKIVKKFKFISDLVVSSVGNVENNAFLSFENDIKIHFVDHEYNFPFTNLYLTPQTLGIDRMVLAAGAVMQFPKKNRLVIDAGTCITYDFVDEFDNYLGGAISPGFNLRYKSLNNYTAKLPLLTLENPQSFIGNTTNSAIHSGVINGLVHEIDGFIEDYKSKYSNFIIILTGGDTDFLAKRLKNTIFANSNFLLESLNHTFQHKIKND